MNEIVSFTKEIDFNNNIDKIISISLEHTLEPINNSSIKGDLILTGTYRQNPVTLIDTPFSYKIPVNIELDSKYNLINITIDIDNFTYEVEGKKLKTNVDLLLDNLETKEEIENLNDLFKEEETEEKLEIVNPPKEEIVKKELIESDSLFDNLNSSGETYVTYSIYIMKENDTIESIMDKYKVSRLELEEYNDLNGINIGTKIIIPSGNE